MSNLVAGPYELEWIAMLEEFFGGHEHLWNPADGLCIADDCPSKKEQEE